MSYNDSVYLETDESFDVVLHDFCGLFLTDFNVEITDYGNSLKVATVHKDDYIIDAKVYTLPQALLESNKQTYDFIPTMLLSIFYRKSVTDWTALQTTVIDATVKLLKLKNCNARLEFNHNTILNFSDRNLILMGVDIWTAARLSLLDGMNYAFVKSLLD